jgi:sortase A
VIPSLSRGLLILGGLMIVAGLGWGIWVRLNPLPPPVITDAGAVVLAVTAPSLPATSTPTPVPATATPRSRADLTQPLPSDGIEPSLLASRTATPTNPPPTPLPPAGTPTSTPVPRAQDPPSRVVAPAIKLDAQVMPMSWELVDHDGTMVSRWVVPEKVAGWHADSGLPGNGENVVLSGHHNIEGKVFRYVVDLEPGDDVTLYVGDTMYTYLVTEKYILKEAGMPLKVRQKNAQWIMPTGDERLTLVTCWPYDWPGNSHRVIVVARPPQFFERSFEEVRARGTE